MQVGKIKLVVGLGTRENKYKNPRHNIGFIFIDVLAKYLNVSEVGLRLAKPQTFMNKSGTAVSALSKHYKTKPENILVIHDDIDILWGRYKFSFGRSSAGHQGVESIIKALKTKNFWRLRIGIQPTVKRHTSADKIILKKFTSAEIKTLNQTIKKAISELERLFKVNVVKI